jgi:hypothetical protein
MWDGTSSAVLSAVSWVATKTYSIFHRRPIKQKTWKHYWIVLEVKLTDNLKKLLNLNQDYGYVLL